MYLSLYVLLTLISIINLSSGVHGDADPLPPDFLICRGSYGRQLSSRSCRSAIAERPKGNNFAIYADGSHEFPVDRDVARIRRPATYTGVQGI